MSGLMNMLGKLKAHVAMLGVQLAFAGLNVIGKDIFTHGTNALVYNVYMHIISTFVLFPVAYFLERGKRPALTFRIFCWFFLLALLGITLSQNLCSVSLYFVSATFQSAMINLIPAVTFVLAALFRQEKLNITSLRSQAKVIGTIVSVGGAMVMTLWNGPVLKTLHQVNNNHANNLALFGSSIIGVFILIVAILSWSIWIILQGTITKLYPAELSMATYLCLIGTVQSTVFTLCIDHKVSSWTLKWDLELLAIFYGGIFCTGIAFFAQMWCSYKKGPVFVTMYSPLLILLCAIMESIFFGQRFHVGSVVGAILIVGGLYALLWGKAKDEENIQNMVLTNTNSTSDSKELPNNITSNDTTKPLLPSTSLV